ncbi:uncharacterized protein FIBRA_07063 [Fibroporia radiculosa]|uniref:Ubiquitin-like-conjugating enzyme ATG10 n=1 Tax=Fibroporia radiculosa TaxID=599839 RepID=J4GU97_9APHY|nr:uncharacterized protein FIBRA_07063 [Fibroporia radiculosa]CCM04870.1 predicted protein [Fibroporia radiculosa]
MSATFTRSQFETACKAYIRVHNASGQTSATAFRPDGWTWSDHNSTIARPGFMHRSALLPLNPVRSLEIGSEEDVSGVSSPIDESVVAANTPILIASEQHVVYSPTFQVPTFYFTMYNSSGAPLTLDQILISPLFHPHSLANAEATSFALTEPGSSFPLLSQGDHPVLGTPSWYLHPCHTAEAVVELMAESPRGDESEERTLVRWMETWFMVLGQVVNLRYRS